MIRNFRFGNNIDKSTNKIIENLDIAFASLERKATSISQKL